MTPAVSTAVVSGPSGTPLTVLAPADGFTAAVVVIQEIWGVTDHLIGQGRSLAEHGFLVVLPHLYHRVGDPVVAQGEFPRAKELLGSLRGPEIEADVLDACAHARVLGAARVGLVGFCMGGTVAFWAAARAPIDAAVTFYGSGIRAGRWEGIPSALELAPDVRVPWLGLYGDLDRSIPTDDVEELRAAVAGLPVATEVVRYPGAGHAFATDPGSDNRVEDAAVDGWARAVTWFEAHLGA